MNSGLRELLVADPIAGLTFPVLVQFPTRAEGPPCRVGPYTFDAVRDAALAEGPFPLVLISHGSGGSHLLYRAIATELARNGFVVAAPEHPGNNRNDNALQDTDGNTVQRPRHASLAIDAVLACPFFQGQVHAGGVTVIGHSIGACTALAMAGGQPWSRSGQPLPVQSDPRLGAAVLLAPATEWFLPEDALRAVTIPLLLIAGEQDLIAPIRHSEIVLARVPDRSRVQLQVIPGAGHFSFLSPFPPELCRPGFAPATDPEGFDRVAFHRELPRMILSFLREHCKAGAVPLHVHPRLP